MYKRSNDRRFIKNKKEIRKAYIKLVIEKGYKKITISDIAERADINRMTFYAHYDMVEDVFNEFLDDMEQEIFDSIKKETTFDIDYFFKVLNGLMYKEIDFFRFVAKEGNCSDFRSAFRKTIKKFIRMDMTKNQVYGETEQIVVQDLASVCIAYSYLDWLAGEYGDMAIHEITMVTKKMLKHQLAYVTYADSKG